MKALRDYLRLREIAGGLRLRVPFYWTNIRVARAIRDAVTSRPLPSAAVYRLDFRTKKRG